MDSKIYSSYVALLKHELIAALGCTEPIAIAYAGAKVREVLGKIPERMSVACSANIIKNVKSVAVPNSGGMHGIEAAAALGAVGGDASRGLEVLQTVTSEEQKKARELLAKNFCSCSLAENVANLYIDIKAEAGSDSAEVEITDYHTNITRIVKNGSVLLEEKGVAEKKEEADESLLNLRSIIDFAADVKLNDVRKELERQIACNSAISAEGLKNQYGASVGRTIMEDAGESVKRRATAAAAAGSDARMSGCSMPVVINSGSGNQGITVTMPVVEYAKTYGKTHDELLRALCISNLVALHQKQYIGSLSAYCGAVCAATGSAAAICWLLGGTYEEIANTITNTIATIGGMVCDGAKSSCAAKIATAVDCAITAMDMSLKNRAFKPGEGLVKDNVEETIKSVGRMGRDGMKSTDVEILHIMLEKNKENN